MPTSGLSASWSSTRKSTQLQAMLVCCRKERPDFVVVYTLDRFARSMEEDHVVIRGALRRVGVQLRAVNAAIGETPEAKFLESVLAAAAQLDNDMRATKSRAGLRAAAEKEGRWVWRALVGYLMRERNLVPDPTKAPLIRKAYELLAAGIFSRNEVLERVTASG